MDLGYSVERKKESKHEPIEQMLTRREKNMARLRAVFGDIPDENHIKVKVLGRCLEFWPCSGSWYSHAKQKFGSNIDEICSLIEAQLRK